ncbi:hypothetical protein EHQ53_04890 [Leptospira langatensis]|uniref:Uncharacterized protein n=1 Tax=Leptospira langatensis TaxID=2484983 RepID=A0A5F1ZWJ6_9LEPT|nr:hypothetical protein [Leptospira langatensis]TGK00152.1 hypothetical protein EHO57_12750 [Leptospira langatensis]TGL42787.1 hypothetical protein EHQ53_04890 [Leptospira langatensis]
MKRIAVLFSLLTLVLLFSVNCGASYVLFNPDTGLLVGSDNSKKKDQEKAPLFALLGIASSIATFSPNPVVIPFGTSGSFYSLDIPNIPNSWTQSEFGFNIFIQASCNNASITTIDGVDGASTSSPSFQSVGFEPISISFSGGNINSNLVGSCVFTHAVHNPTANFLPEGFPLGNLTVIFDPFVGAVIGSVWFADFPSAQSDLIGRKQLF